MKMMMWDNFRAVKKIIIFICWQWQLKMVSTGVETSNKTKIYFHFKQEKNVTDAKKYIVIVTDDFLVNNLFS